MANWNELKARLPEMPLTPRLREVANLLAAGRTPREISKVLGIPESRVKYCIGYVMYAMRQRPPADSATVQTPKLPKQPPMNTGVALELPRSAA